MIKNILAVLIVGLFATGCSTMISPEKTTVYIKSHKKGQPFIIKDNKGAVVARATTPAVIKLDNKGDSTYTYLTQCQSKREDSELNEWVLGNLITVSITGFIIDVTSGYSNEPADKVSLLDCDIVKAKRRVASARKQKCESYVNQYDRSVYSFKSRKNKSTIYNLKHTQDALLKYCSSYVDISHHKKQASAVNKVYNSYL